MEKKDKNDLGAQSATEDVSAGSIASESAIARHTPGPWRVSMSGYSIKSNDDDMPIVANNPWGVGMREKDIPRWLANADVIAVAPAMLALLRKFAQGDMKLPHSEYDMQLRSDARALIAKAEGR